MTDEELRQELAAVNRRIDDLAAELRPQIRRLHDNDLEQHEDIRKALEALRTTSAAVEILLREKYAKPEPSPTE